MKRDTKAAIGLGAAMLALSFCAGAAAQQPSPFVKMRLAFNCIPAPPTASPLDMKSDDVSMVEMYRDNAGAPVYLQMGPGKRRIIWEKYLNGRGGEAWCMISQGAEHDEKKDSI